MFRIQTRERDHFAGAQTEGGKTVGEVGLGHLKRRHFNTNIEFLSPGGIAPWITVISVAIILRTWIYTQNDTTVHEQDILSIYPFVILHSSNLKKEIGGPNISSVLKFFHSNIDFQWEDSVTFQNKPMLRGPAWSLLKFSPSVVGIGLIYLASLVLHCFCCCCLISVWG